MAKKNKIAKSKGKKSKASKRTKKALKKANKVAKKRKKKRNTEIDDGVYRVDVPPPSPFSS